MTQQHTIDPDGIYDEAESATLIKSTPASLERWRRLGTGPKFIKVGHRVRYTGRHLGEWVDQQTRTHTGERPNKAVRRSARRRRGDQDKDAA